MNALKDAVDKLIAQNDEHQKNWNELVWFLRERADDARRNNMTQSANAYERTMSKILELMRR